MKHLATKLEAVKNTFELLDAGARGNSALCRMAQGSRKLTKKVWVWWVIKMGWWVLFFYLVFLFIK
jgi:hypothetical protein